MVETKLQQLYRITCDSCGRPAVQQWAPTTEEARKAAYEYTHSTWTQGGALRESWLCPDCYARGINEAQGRPPV